MKKLLALSLILFFPLSAVALATSDTSAAWESVAFDAGGHRVEIKAAPLSYKITSLKVWISGKSVKIPKSEYEQIANPNLAMVVIVDINRPNNSTLPPEADLEIPLEATEGGFKDAGTWEFRIVNGKYLSKQLRPPEAKN